jgi:hypothetical protein
MNQAAQLMLQSGGVVVNWEGRALGAELGAVLGTGDATGGRGKPQLAADVGFCW